MEPTREAPSVLAARAVLAIEHALIDPTAEGVAAYLNVYRSTAFRLLSRLVEAGILTRRMEQRDRIPQLGVYSVQLPTRGDDEPGRSGER